MWCLHLHNRPVWFLRQQATQCLVPVQLKHNLFSFKIFLWSETDFTSHNPLIYDPVGRNKHA